jgi:protein-S-isoprenylcysteine O-methyltransferase Ste14
MISSGPYRWIRHPMYAAVILCGIAAAASIATPGGWLCLIALIAVLVIKLQVEEQLLMRKYPQYAAYRSHTWRLLPGVF